MKVLITGIDGFTGIHLKNYLSKDYEVFGTSRKIENKNIFKCDILGDLKSIINKIEPDYIIHLAALSFVEDGGDFYKINSLGTQNLLESVKKVKKIIVVSSAVVYGNQNKTILEESMCPNPNNHYGLSKFSAEQITKNYFNKLNIIITRPFNYTGIYQNENFLIPKIVNHFRNKKNIIELGNLDVIREFNDIKFMCESYKRLLKSDIKGEIVNIASNRGIKLLDVINTMEEIAGYNIEVKINQNFVRKNEIKKLLGSNKKLFNLIGEIKQKEFKETLKEMYSFEG